MQKEITGRLSACVDEVDWQLIVQGNAFIRSIRGGWCGVKM